MFDTAIKAGTTSKIIEVGVRDSTTGAGKTGLAHGSVTASYVREGGTRTAITLASGSAGDAYSSGKWAEVDATNCKGVYQLHLPNAAIASGVAAVTIVLQASGMIDKHIRIALPSVDLFDATALGLTRLDATIGSRASQTSLDAVDDYVDTEIAAIKAKTDNLPSDPADASDIAAAFSSLNTKVDTIDDLLDTEIAAIKAKTDNLPSDPADASDVAAAVAAVSAKIDTVDDLIDTEVGAIKSVTDKIDTAMESDGGVYRFTTNALEQAPSGGGGGSSDWTADEKTVIKTVLGIPSSGTTPESPTAGALKDIDDHIDTEVAAIKAKTDNLPSDPADASDISAAFSTVNGSLSTLASSLSTLMGYVDTEVAAIKAKTDNLPADPADASDIAASLSSITSSLSTIASYVDTEVASILAAVDTEIAAIKAKTDNLPASPAATGDIPTAAAIRSEMDANSTKLANLDATVSSRLATAGYTAPDNAGITSAAASAASAASSSSAIATILTGITRLGHWLRAMIRNSTPDATALSEINTTGGTYAPADESLQAIAASGGGGGGGGVADWTNTEKQQIRYRLGLDGTGSAPTNGTPHLGIPTFSFLRTISAVVDSGRQSIVQGSAYLAAFSTAPYCRLLKSQFNLADCTAEYRVRMGVGGAATVDIFDADITSLDADTYQVSCDLTNADTLGIEMGNGMAQFWILDDDGNELCVAQSELTVTEGIDE